MSTEWWSALSSYPDADQHGPTPIPDSVITSGNAVDENLGVLKTGKEADVSLLERRLDERVNLLAAKRYRNLQERAFRNDVAYRADRNLGRKAHREQRAIDKGTRTGLALHADLWAAHEFETLSRLWQLGLPVPYPVQRVGTEIVLEYLGDDDGAAPRLVQVRVSTPSPSTPSCWTTPSWCEPRLRRLRLHCDLGAVGATVALYCTQIGGGGHQVSIMGRFFPVRGGGGGAESRAATIQRRESAGSMTSSISK